MNKRIKKQIKVCLDVEKVLSNDRELALIMYASAKERKRYLDTKIPIVDDQKKRVNDVGKEYIEHNRHQDTNSDEYKVYEQFHGKSDNITKHGSLLVQQMESLLWAEINKLVKIMDESITS